MHLELFDLVQLLKEIWFQRKGAKTLRLHFESFDLFKCLIEIWVCTLVICSLSMLNGDPCSREGCKNIEVLALSFLNALINLMSKKGAHDPSNVNRFGVEIDICYNV